MSNELKNTGNDDEVDEKTKRLIAKLERFLSRACKAEMKENYLNASRCFVLAVYCEARIRKVVGVYEDTRSVLPVY